MLPEEKFEDFTKETVVLKGILEHFADGSQEASLSIHAHVEQSVFNDLVHHLSVEENVHGRVSSSEFSHKL